MTTLTGESRGRTVAAWGRPVRVVLGVGPVVFALAFVSARVWGLDDGWATWWPAAAPAALAVAFLRCDGTVRRPANRALLVGAALVAIGVGSWAAHLLDGRHPGPDDGWVPAGWALVDVAQATVTGLVLAGRGGLRMRRTPDLARLAAAALAGAVVAGGIAWLVAAPRLPDGAAVLWGVGTSRVFAVILLVPLAMTLPAHPRRASGAERALLWGIATGTTVVVLAVPGMLPLAFLPATVLIVAALRQTPRATTALLVVVAAVVVVATERGDGPFARVGDGLAALLAQSYLAVGVVTVLTVMLVVSARDAALHEMDARDRFARSVLESVASGVLVTDADGRVLARNAAYRGQVDAGDATGDGRLWPGEHDLVTRALSGEELRGVQTRVGSSGRSADLVAETRPVRSADGTLLGAVATFTDITDERAVQTRLREAVAFQDAVLAASPDVIFVTDVATHRVVWASGTVEPTLGYTPTEVVELDRASRLNLVHPDDVGTLHAADAAAARLRDGEVWTVRVRMSTERGNQRWMSRRVTPFSRDPDGRVVQLLGVSRDVTDVVEVERRLTDAANRDPLTGALNRRALLERLGVLVTRVAESDSVTTPVLFCDLDGFKAVNDSLGHVAGDRLLTTVAERISETLRDGDVLARAGGDEFVLLLEPPRGGLPDRSASPVGISRSRAEVLHRARTVGRRILDAVSRPVEVQGTHLTVTLSIGIALVRPGIGPDEVLRDADAAMYRAKSTGKNRMHVFEVAPERGHDDR